MDNLFIIIKYELENSEPTEQIPRPADTDVALRCLAISPNQL